MAAVALLAVTCLAVPARAQEVITKESAAALKAAYVADVGAMHTKFLGLAQAFPEDKYTWRPMDGVRSVSEVLTLIAFEGYVLVPSMFGGKADATVDRAKISALTDKAQIVDHINKAFAHAKAQLEAIDPATLTGKRKIFGRDMSFGEGALALSGDMHEHLGQLIAYARTNRIVPPWSK